MTFEKKCVNFVNHIQSHLDNGDTGLRLYKLRDKPNTVGCAICGKTIDEINSETKSSKEDASNESFIVRKGSPKFERCSNFTRQHTLERNRRRMIK